MANLATISIVTDKPESIVIDIDDLTKKATARTLTYDEIQRILIYLLTKK